MTPQFNLSALNQKLKALSDQLEPSRLLANELGERIRAQCPKLGSLSAGLKWVAQEAQNRKDARLTAIDAAIQAQAPIVRRNFVLTIIDEDDEPTTIH